MPTGPDGQKRPGNPIACAVTVARIATGEEEETTFKQPQKRPGGQKGGAVRAEKLSAEQRKEIATNAAKKRWGKE